MRIEIAFLLPIAAFVAIGLFVIKEIIEFCRRRAERARRLTAAKRLLAFETERNFYSQRQLFEIVEDIRFSIGDRGNYDFFVRAGADGQQHYRRREAGSNSIEAGMPIPLIYMGEFDRWIPSVAELSAAFYGEMMASYDTIFELEHLRSSLVHYLARKEHEELGDLEGFVEYAARRAEQTESVIRSFYKNCTGSSDVPIRIR